MVASPVTLKGHMHVCPMVDPGSRPHVGGPVMQVTAGQAVDAPMAEKLLSDVRTGVTILADKAYDTDAIRHLAIQLRC